MAKVIGYLRVSSDGQAEHGYGLDVQRERIAAYAVSQGFAIDEFIVDDGYSGTTIDRPGLKRLLVLCESGEMTHGMVIVYKLDRLSRSLKNLLNVYSDYFEKNDVFLASVSEQFSTSTPQGRLFFNIIGSFAEYDHDIIVERLAGGRSARASSGERAVGAVPYGYESVDVNGRKTTKINEKEARIVRRIFAMRNNDSLSQEAIANELNDANVPGPRGGRWHQSAISTILRNPIYSGKTHYDAGGGGSPIIADNANLALI